MIDTKAKMLQQLEALETDLNATLQTLSTLMANSTQVQMDEIIMPVMQDYRIIKMCIKTSKEKVAKHV